MEKYLEKVKVKKYIFNYIKNDVFISELLKKNIIWGENYEFLFDILIDENSDVIDCGSYIGTLTMLMSQYISKNNKVHSFEPTFYEVLIKNIIENEIYNVVCYNVGLSDSDFIIPSFDISLEHSLNYGSFFYKITDDDKVSLDKCLPDVKYLYFNRLDTHDFNNISFIKIDVELNEKYVLDGAINTLIKNNYPSIFIELFVTENKNIENHLEIIKDNTFHCFSKLSLLGYICIPINPVDGDFIFIHSSKTDKIQKVLNYIKDNEILDNEYYIEIINDKN